MNMTKVCGKMPREARLKQNWGISVNERAIIKYFIFREIWKLTCVVQNFPVFYLNSLCLPCLEKLITKFPVFPVPCHPEQTCTFLTLLNFYFLFFFPNRRTLKFMEMKCNPTNKKIVAYIRRHLFYLDYVTR